jgi:hypothetical protein
MRRGSKVVILGRENEGCEPKVRKDPGNRGEVSFVRLNNREKQGGDVHECVDGSLLRINSLLLLLLLLSGQQKDSKLTMVIQYVKWVLVLKSWMKYAAIPKTIKELAQ